MFPSNALTYSASCIYHELCTVTPDVVSKFRVVVEIQDVSDAINIRNRLCVILRWR